MIVILDTNVLVADFSLEGNQFRILFAGRKQIGARVYVPAVALAELKTKYEETLVEQRGAITKAEARLRTLGAIPDSHRPKLDVQDLTEEYAARVSGIMKNHEVAILPFPKIDHEEVVTRDLSRRKPFGRPSGYRDYLIWRSVIPLLRRGEPVVFITQDASDFSQDGKLHPDLVKDLSGTWGEEQRLRLCHSLSEFNATYVSPVLDRAAELASALEERGLPGLSLQEWVAANLDSVLERDDLLVVGLGVEGPNLGSAGSPRLAAGLSVEIDDVYQTGSEEYVAIARIRAPVRFEVSFTYEDLRRSPRLQEVFGDDGEPFASGYGDWENIFDITGSFRIGGNPPRVQFFEVQDVDAEWV